jgi:hypothetical protein
MERGKEILDKMVIKDKEMEAKQKNCKIYGTRFKVQEYF